MKMIQTMLVGAALLLASGALSAGDQTTSPVVKVATQKANKHIVTSSAPTADKPGSCGGMCYRPEFGGPLVYTGNMTVFLVGDYGYGEYGYEDQTVFEWLMKNRSTKIRF